MKCFARDARQKHVIIAQLFSTWLPFPTLLRPRISHILLLLFSRRNKKFALFLINSANRAISKQRDKTRRNYKNRFFDFRVFFHHVARRWYAIFFPFSRLTAFTLIKPHRHFSYSWTSASRALLTYSVSSLLKIFHLQFFVSRYMYIYRNFSNSSTFN